MDELIQAMKAAGEPTRMRILVVLDRSELTVTELCRILGQSQPRVSRHLKVLCDAGLLARQTEGTSAYYRHARSPFARQFISSLAAQTDGHDPTVERDQQQLALIRAQRAELAVRSFEKIAQEAELLEDERVPVAEVEAAMLDLVGPGSLGRLLDVGTGTGRVLELFAPMIDAGIGIELSLEMLNLARTKLDANHLHHCSVRHGNAYNLDVETGSISLAVLHHVLHFLEEPARAIEQAAQTIEPQGRLLIVDFAPHLIEALRADHGHRRLGFADEEVTEWCQTAGMGKVEVSHLDLDQPDPPGLTITLWLATQPSDGPHTTKLVDTP
jgi:DNA-binding transcriptional ArsR family regulator